MIYLPRLYFVLTLELRESSTRRPVQGMGLSHAPTNVINASRREPLAALDIGDGGDVKRVKR